MASIIDDMAVHTGGLTGVQHVAPKGTILDRAVCLVLNRGKFGNSRKASVSKLMEIARDEINATEHGQTTPNLRVDRTLVSASKKLLDSTALRAIQQLDREVFVYLGNLALPSMFKSGVHLVPIPLVEKVEADLRVFRDRRAQLVEAFLEVYPDQVRDIEKRLGDLFNPLDYPDAAKLRQSFTFDWQYVTFGVPGSLKGIKASLFEDERNKYAVKLQEAADACRMALRAGMAEVVSSMVDRLTPTADGKKKVFKAATVSNVSEFLKTFEMRNVTDDAELGALVTQARELLNGVDPDVLRNDDHIRQGVQEGFAAIAASLDTMGVDRGSRSIDLFGDL